MHELPRQAVSDLGDFGWVQRLTEVTFLVVAWLRGSSSQASLGELVTLQGGLRTVRCCSVAG